MTWTRVSNLARQIRGVSYEKSEASTAPAPGLLPVLRAGNIGESGLTFDDLVYVPAHRVSAAQKVRRGDVIVAASSGSLDVVGKAALAIDDFDGGFGAFCKVLRPGPGVDPRYFAHYFRTKQYRRRVSALAAGININNLRAEHLDDLEIPLPSLAEQRRIADILDRADAMRAKRREAIALLAQLERSVFADCFGDPAANSRRWPEVHLDSVARVVTGNTPSRAEAGNFGDHIEWIKSDNIDPSLPFVTSATEGLSATGARTARVAPVEATLVTCIAGSRNSIGNASMVNRPVAFNQQINAVVPVDVDAWFLRGWIRAAKGLIQSASTDSMKGMVAKSKLEGVRIIAPPRELQTRFGAIARSLDANGTAHRASLAEMYALFASLQHRAFRGEL